eukprot:1591232-Pyramimonas_sp.AAC.1
MVLRVLHQPLGGYAAARSILVGGQFKHKGRCQPRAAVSASRCNLGTCSFPNGRCETSKQNKHSGFRSASTKSPPTPTRRDRSG